MAAVYTLTESSSRVFGAVSMILSYTAMSSYANAGTHGLILPPGGYPRTGLGCSVAGGYVSAPLTGYLDCLAKGTSFPDPIQLQHVKAEVTMAGPYVATKGSAAMGSTVFAAIFATFAEQAKDWVHQNIATDHALYPPVTNFARVFRNAVAHGGRVNIDNPNATSVSWRGKTISHADNKRQIVGSSEFAPGDVVMLLLDLDEELNGLGAPNPLF